MKTFHAAIAVVLVIGWIAPAQSAQAKKTTQNKPAAKTTTKPAAKKSGKPAPQPKAKSSAKAKPAKAKRASAPAPKSKPTGTAASSTKTKRARTAAPSTKTKPATPKTKPVVKPAPTTKAKPRKPTPPPPSAKGWAKVVKTPTSMATAKGVRSVPVRTYINSVGMRFVWIPPGEFMMGSPETEPGRHDDETLHRVEITEGFFMSTTEVTVGQWKQFLKRTKHDWNREAILALTSPTDEHPVAHVSHDDAVAFCKWLSTVDKGTYRLPTEAEWEYACRAGSDAAFTWGSEPNKKLMACDTKSASSEPVAGYPANRWGLHDMHGNVWEWCRDWFARGAYADHAAKNPTGPESGDAHVIRGGSWQDSADYCRAANRSGRWPTERYEDLGFRVVRIMP